MKDYYAEAMAELDAEFPSVSFIEWNLERREKAVTQRAWTGFFVFQCVLYVLCLLWAWVSFSGPYPVLALIPFVPAVVAGYCAHEMWESR